MRGAAALFLTGLISAALSASAIASAAVLVAPGGLMQPNPGSMAVAYQPFVPLDADDCSAIPGAVVHDDGTYENGFGGYWEMVTSARFVDRFTPSFYPATYSTVCIAFSQEGDSAAGFDFDIVAYDDDGEDGAPGTLLGTVPAHVATLPDYAYGAIGEFIRVDISALHLQIADGSVYLGAQWNPSLYPGVLQSVNVDSSGGPPAFGYDSLNQAPWSTLFTGYPPYLGFPDYTALQVRAVERSPEPRLGLIGAETILNDRCTANPDHNNGVAEPGEIVDIAVPVFSSGGDFLDVNVSLVPPAPDGVSYIDSAVALGFIPDGRRVVAGFRVQLDRAAACLQILQLPVSLDSAQGTFAATLELPVGQPASAVGPSGLPVKTNYDASALTSVIHVAQSAVLSDLQVRVDLQHYSVQAVEITLTSPSGITVTLLDRPGYPPSPGCENKISQVLFTDGAPDPEHICDTAGSDWPVDTAGPVDPLSTFAGENMQGDWTLTVRDYWSGSIGALMDWALIPSPAFSNTCAICAADGLDPIFADGFEG